MEKFTPHCKLSLIKNLIKAKKVRTTFSALAGGEALGFTFNEMVDVIVALTAKDFYKSMTTHADRVYRPITRAGEVYLKLTVIDDVLIVSFKEL